MFLGSSAVEQLAVNQLVASSILARGAIISSFKIKAFPKSHLHKNKTEISCVRPVSVFSR